MNNITTGYGAISDGKDTNANVDPTRILDNNTKILIIYFSRSGNTEKQAKLAQDVLNSDIFELTVSNPYPSNYKATVNRATNERDAKNWPELNSDIPNLDKYDTILLGHPIWAMTIANPMREFLEEYGTLLSNKSVASFSTNDGYGSGETNDVISRLTTGSTKLLTNYTIRDTMAKQDRTNFINWLKKINK
ncbi:flavodoxin [Companilactobacillus allii]|uniref:Flavodoxin n=1 Tax=Companilactobacillus allii TaxID=1847728 RepID=A0A1P8Q5V9_9LACO|nr:flavodoxin [Companilactobacillus allii]APX73203.1 flavodoxin [Companilactobacillus allii]USQ68012.1 flavodoxin [Companilactobacillus allii]